MARLGEFDAAVRLLRGAFLLDHSVSVSELGSLFRRDLDTPVRQLKRNVANAYGAAWSFPSSSGTSSLNVLGLLALAPPGGTVLINRDCHVSMLAALVHGGYRPVYYHPRFDDAFGIPLGPTAQDVEVLLERHPDTCCVVLTYPNYFGIAGDCAGIVAAAHARGIPVLADAAHGAPFHFCTGLPAAAEDLGADLVLQSTHKSMGALSQGSLALFASNRYVDRFYEAVTGLGFVSTSFSYPTLSSIELAVDWHLTHGEERWRSAIDEAERFRAMMRDVKGVAVFDASNIGVPGFRDLDRTRVTLDLRDSGLSGYEMERALEAEQIYPEMATSRHVLLLFTPGTRPADTVFLAGAVDRITHARRTGHGRSADARPQWHAPTDPALVLPPREAYFADKQVVPLAEAVGAISGETIAPYPPGSMVVAAGERLSAEILDYLAGVHRAGGVLHGASDASFRTIRIIPAS